MQRQAKIANLRMYMRILTVLSLVLLAILTLFQSIWVYGGSETSIMLQAGLQRTRAQAIAKDVLIMAYRHEADTQAVAELQAVLPVFEHAQAGLAHGDSSLQLPAHVPDDIAQAVADAQSDYTLLDTAARIIAAYPETPVDPVELSIVLSHERPYALEMTTVIQLWQTRIDSAFFQIFLWETGLTCATMLTVGGKYFFFTRQVLRRMTETEKPS